MIVDLWSVLDRLLRLPAGGGGCLPSSKECSAARRDRTELGGTFAVGLCLDHAWPCQEVCIVLYFIRKQRAGRANMTQHMVHLCACNVKTTALSVY